MGCKTVLALKRYPWCEAGGHSIICKPHINGILVGIHACGDRVVTPRKDEGLSRWVLGISIHLDRHTVYHVVKCVDESMAMREAIEDWGFPVVEHTHRPVA